MFGCAFCKDDLTTYDNLTALFPLQTVLSICQHKINAVQIYKVFIAQWFSSKILKIENVTGALQESASCVLKFPVIKKFS